MSAWQELMEAAQHGDRERVQAIVETDGALVNARDESGATALHYAAIHGHRAVVRCLVEHGGDINSADGRHGATPAGWAIEYLREMGGHLGIELSDLAYAIRQADVRWVHRFLTRFPKLREAKHTDGTPFAKMARDSGNAEIMALFELQAG